MKYFLKSFGYAFIGIKASFKGRNMKIILCCAMITLLLGFFFSISSIEWCVILICIGIVIALETINTAIENLVNLVEPNDNPNAGLIKDLAAGATLQFSIISFLIGLIIFGKYVIKLI
ncbi:MAG: diacylglycerol kinase family protein [Bacteroidota bacterium]